MHIVQVTPRYLPSRGGVEEVVANVSERLVRLGHKVTVYSIDLTSNLPANENINGVTVKRFKPLFGDPLFLPDPKFVSALKKENADVLHVHNIHTLPPLLAALGKTKNQKLILQPHYHRFGQSTFRNFFFEVYKKASYGLIFKRTDVVIANSTFEEKILREDISNAKRIVLVPEGLDITDGLSVKRNPVEPKRVLYVGVLKGYKNVDKVLTGFSLLTNPSKDYRLVIVGEGPEQASLLNIAHKLSIINRVEWKGRLSRDALLKEYAKASVLVLLSSLESFSRVVYDALILGLPVVVYNYGALASLVSLGYAEGVNSLTPNNIAQALTCAMDKTYPKIPLTNGAFLDWQTYVRKLLELYS
jgi:glycosyltransferase involved in cell wall biosynthesis